MPHNKLLKTHEEEDLLVILYGGPEGIAGVVYLLLISVLKIRNNEVVLIFTSDQGSTDRSFLLSRWHLFVSRLLLAEGLILTICMSFLNMLCLFALLCSSLSLR